MKIISKIILFAAALFGQVSFAQNKAVILDCSARLENGVLTLENSRISRTYQWNDGNIITSSLTDKSNGKIWKMNGIRPDLALPVETINAANAVFNAKIVDETAIAPARLEAEIVYTLGKLEVKRVFRLYPNCPAIAYDLYFRGSSANTWIQPGTNLADVVNMERLAAGSLGSNAPVMEKLELPGRHWQLNAVEFFDITDGFNTLRKSVLALSYRPNYYRGNLLYAYDNVTENGVFILKEAPISNVQLAYPGSDFITEYGTFMTVGIGISPADLDTVEWKRGYGFVSGVYSGNEKNGLMALRNYQNNIRLHKPGRDEMLLMNTWGDRGQDSRVRESFALAELEVGAKLGITHFQLDDGWQSGQTSNSALKGGSLESIWKNSRYWEPHPERFPNGLDPVVKKGKELGIEVCLWFNPSKDNSNENWEKDASVLIGLYRKYGIRTFKIDGVNLPDKTAEMNFRKFFQIEFLNKWRNTDKYTNDPFGPANYSFDYLFAITMAAQPLAWFEGTGLPAEAITVGAPVIKKYREIQTDLHKGDIFPIGDEPSGRSWTGFQSVMDRKGFFIIFREDNDNTKCEMETWLTEGKSVKFTPIVGNGAPFTAKVGKNGLVTFGLPEKNSYALYAYTVD